jgi:hypothetical protein
MMLWDGINMKQTMNGPASTIYSRTIRFVIPMKGLVEKP